MNMNILRAIGRIGTTARISIHVLRLEAPANSNYIVKFCGCFYSFFFKVLFLRYPCQSRFAVIFEKLENLFSSFNTNSILTLFLPLIKWFA